MEFHLDTYVSSLLDVGANQGVFSKSFKDRYRIADIVCIEPNPFLKDHLNTLGLEVHSVGASNKNSKAIFHVNSNNKTSTGNSFYLEQTVHYSSTEEVEVNIVRLDDFFAGRTFDFIKIDTQGSEYDIVDGAKELIKKCKFLLIEVPFFPFNKGAPLANSVIPLIASLGLKPYSFPEFHRAIPAHFPGFFTDKFSSEFITHMDILWKNG